MSAPVQPWGGAFLYWLLLGRPDPRLGFGGRMAYALATRALPTVVATLGHGVRVRGGRGGMSFRSRLHPWLALGLAPGRQTTVGLGPALPGGAALRRMALGRYLADLARPTAERLPGQPHARVGVLPDASAPRLLATEDLVLLGMGWVRREGLDRAGAAIGHLLVHQSLLALDGEPGHTATFNELAARAGVPAKPAARRCVVQ